MYDTCCRRTTYRAHRRDVKSDGISPAASGATGVDRQVSLCISYFINKGNLAVLYDLYSFTPDPHQARAHQAREGRNGGEKSTAKCKPSQRQDSPKSGDSLWGGLKSGHR